MKRKLFQALASFLVLGLGMAVAYHLLSSKPKRSVKKRKKPALVVRTTEVVSKPFVYTVETTGTVVITRKTEISAEVSGKVIYVSPRLLPGEIVEAGDLLVKIDPTDYEALIAQREAELREAEKVLAEISAKAERAIAEWRALRPRIPAPPLVAKKPQLAAAQARVSAAKALLRKARTDLSRTEIRAPYRGRVLEVYVEVGSYASPGKTLAVIYPLKALEIYAPVADHFLPYIRVPGLNTTGKGSSVEILWEVGEKTFRYSGTVVRAGGAIEEKTKLLPLYIRLKSSKNKPPLLPETFVTVRFIGKRYPAVFVLPKEALHRLAGETFVWVVQKGVLEQRKVEVLWEDEKMVAVVRGLSSGEKVVIQRLRGAIAGTPVREIP